MDCFYLAYANIIQSMTTKNVDQIHKSLPFLFDR